MLTRVKIKKHIKPAIVTIISIILALNCCSRVFSQPKLTPLKSKSCRSETRLRSRSSSSSTNVRFINRQRFVVKVYWIDFAGKRQHYFDLEPNEVRWQQTFTTHPWVITSAGENQPCLDIFLPPSLTDGVAIID